MQLIQRALETIGGNLQRQYERWLPSAIYRRQSLDPTVGEMRRLATGLRRSVSQGGEGPLPLQLSWSAKAYS